MIQTKWIKGTAAKELRQKENLNAIPNNRPGYYKWWATKDDLLRLLKPLKVDFKEIEPYLEIKDDWYCIYVGIAVNESVRSRLNWHINDPHTLSRVTSGTLSTLRQSLASLLSNNQSDKDTTNKFIDNLLIDYCLIDAPVHSAEARQICHDEFELPSMQKKLYILNIQENHHIQAKEICKRLKLIRKNAKSCL